jgi:hypothetical protein
MGRPRPSGESDPLRTPTETAAAFEAAVGVYVGVDPYPALPLPPPAWVKIAKSPQEPDLGDEFEAGIGDESIVNPEEVWVAPPIHWHFTYAAKILELVPYQSILASKASSPFLELLSGQLAWTTAKLSPSWVKPGRRDRNSPQIFEWTHEGSPAVSVGD